MMNETERRAVAHKTLVQVFRQAPEGQRANLMWHVKRSTPICAGEKAVWFTDGRGGA